MDYWTEDGLNLIKQWYDTQEAKVQVAFDFALKEMLITKDLTGSEQFKPMRRHHAGLWEVVLEVHDCGKKRQIRPVGFWHYGQRDFILVDACEKSGRFTIPAGVFDSASDILGRFFHEGRGTIYEHSF
jgi:hypothetical protein